MPPLRASMPASPEPGSTSRPSSVKTFVRSPTLKLAVPVTPFDVDTDDARPTASDEPSESKTQATFRVIDGQRYVIPGDWATVDADGTVQLLGRGSVCINTGGEKVFPEEVEEVLKEHPDVTDAAVVGVPDEQWGEAIVALVEPRAGVAVDEPALIAHVKDRLARYKAPKRVVEVTSVARAANGKLDYRAAKATATSLASAG